MCSSSRKLVTLLLVSSCFGAISGGVVSVVCSIVLSNDIKPFMQDLTRAANRPFKPQKSRHNHDTSHKDDVRLEVPTPLPYLEVLISLQSHTTCLSCD